MKRKMERREEKRRGKKYKRREKGRQKSQYRDRTRDLLLMMKGDQIVMFRVFLGGWGGGGHQILWGIKYFLTGPTTSVQCGPVQLDYSNDLLSIFSGMIN